MSDQGYPTNNPVPPPQQPYYAPPKPAASPKAITAMILGIVSLCFIFTGPWAFIGVAAGVAGLILAIMAKKEQPSSVATAGLIMSIIGIALCLLFGIICTAAICALQNAGNQWQYELESMLNEATNFTIGN